jgi:hypothetical protein
VKVLLVHNFYGSAAPSGENQVFEAEKALLQAHGHEVEEFARRSDEIRSQGVWGVARGALATPWNPWMTKAIKRAVTHFRPDVVHVHNTFPLISPGIFHAIGQRAARVLTLHNYRLFCPAAIPMRAGRVCTDCLDICSPLPALQYGCYRGSRLATLPLALSVAMHRAVGYLERASGCLYRALGVSAPAHGGIRFAGSEGAREAQFLSGFPPVQPWQGTSALCGVCGQVNGGKGRGQPAASLAGMGC